MGLLMTTIPTFKRSLLFSIVWLISFTALAQDSVADREAAADRYLRVMPTAQMLDDAFLRLCTQMPSDQRVQCFQRMKAAVQAEALDKIARTAMVKTFSADELNALADFYGSKHGVSAMQKFGIYMGQVMPAVQAEIQRGLQQAGVQSKQ